MSNSFIVITNGRQHHEEIGWKKKIVNENII